MHEIFPFITWKEKNTWNGQTRERPLYWCLSKFPNLSEFRWPYKYYSRFPPKKSEKSSHNSFGNEFISFNIDRQGWKTRRCGRDDPNGPMCFTSCRAECLMQCRQSITFVRLTRLPPAQSFPPTTLYKRWDHSYTGLVFEEKIKKKRKLNLMHSAIFLLHLPVSLYTNMHNKRIFSEHC